MTTATKDNPLLDFVTRYKDDPVAYVTEILGVAPQPYQAEALRALASGERKMSIRSGHGCGKSSFASWAMLWFLTFRFPCKVIVTAPTSAQLFDALFAELRRWVGEMPRALQQLYEMKTDRVELVAAPAEAFISARTSRAETPEALAGVHSEHVLLVADEASGIPEQVYEAAGGSMSGHSATTLLLGNPTRSSGLFFDSHGKMKDRWWTRRWSCIESPLVSDEFVQEMAERYGVDSNAYRIRVLGEFPLADDNTIIPYHLAEAATKRDIEAPEQGTVIWAVDPARFGSDRTAFCKRVGPVITELTSWQNLDTMQTVGRVKAEYDGLPGSRRPSEILVDSIGIGAGVVDRLREMGLPARGVNVSEVPSMGQSYSNLRTELWFKVKAWLEDRSCRIPDNEDLLSELTSIRYSFTSSGKLMAESKESMKKRGLRSPDLADAVCLTMASTAITALSGSAGKWNAPIRRRLRGIA